MKKYKVHITEKYLPKGGVRIWCYGYSKQDAIERINNQTASHGFLYDIVSIEELPKYNLIKWFISLFSGI